MNDKIEEYVTTKEFRVIPKNFLGMADKAIAFKFDACAKTIEMNVLEMKDFSVLNWVAGLLSTDDEVITLISSENDKILCMLRFCDLNILSHELNFTKTGFYEPGMELYHKIVLKYKTMERVNEIINKKGQNGRKEQNINGDGSTCSESEVTSPSI